MSSNLQLISSIVCVIYESRDFNSDWSVLTSCESVARERETDNHYTYEREHTHIEEKEKRKNNEKIKF